MRWRSLAVLVLVSGCQRSESREAPPSAPPAPPLVLERPPGTDKGAEAKPAAESALAPTPASAAPLPANALAEQSWSVRSADGLVELRQLALRDGKDTRCESSATVTSPLDGENVAWKWNTCLATREQLKFVSPDGKRVIVLEPSPTSVQGDWKSVEVATLYEHGLRMSGTTAGALVESLDTAPEPSQRFAWLKGTAPRYTSNGAEVEAEMVDGRSFRLGFQGQGFPEPSKGSTTVAMYRYEDNQKTSHFVANLADIPERYRSRAVPVRSEVDLLVASGPLEKVEPPPAEPPSSKSTAPGSLEGLLPPGTSLDLQGKNPAQLLKEAEQGMKEIKNARRNLQQLESER
jgi:hypothetical protein